MDLKYKRIIMKISGEALSSSKGEPLDFAIIHRVADANYRYRPDGRAGWNHCGRRQYLERPRQRDGQDTSRPYGNAGHCNQCACIAGYFRTKRDADACADRDRDAADSRAVYTPPRDSAPRKKPG